MSDNTSQLRRDFLKAVASTGIAAAGGTALAQAFSFSHSQRHPDPSMLILAPSFGCANLEDGPKRNRL